MRKHISVEIERFNGFGNLRAVYPWMRTLRTPFVTDRQTDNVRMT